MKYLSTIGFIFSTVFLPVLAQENLVPNPSFENIIGKPKKIGEVDKAAPWISPTTGTAEIFWSGSKSEDIATPKNNLGFQHAKSGDNYAGAIFYDKKNPNLREYIQVELKSPLEEGKIYCVEFFVNISDLSKYSIDLVGAHLSDKKISSTTMEPLNVVPQVLNKQGRVLSNQVDWEIVCGEYKATGGEKYLTIGNFANDKQVQIGRMKKSKDIAGSQNEYGYYFIDDVSVIEQNSSYKCDCFKKMHGANATQMNFVYSKVEGENEERRLKPEHLIESMVIKFDDKKADLSASAIADLKIIAKIMMENENFSLEAFGFADDTELASNADLAIQRADIVINYLVKNGVRKENLLSKSSKVKDAKQAARKVEFSITLN
jgi:OmpA-OmpF porin, OOP family